MSSTPPLLMADLPDRSRILPDLPEVVTQGTVFLDADLRVLAADNRFYTCFHVTADETEGRLLQDLGNGQWSGPELQELLRYVLKEDRSFTDHEV
ncbi:MAG: PAS domain-containing protein, partial [Flavobacteriales bacterium]|nr:PAS domain-containing protein [Flavobacteriales bacterium]